MRVPRPGHLACGATKNWGEGARVLSHRWPVTRLPWGPGAEENFRGDHRPGGPHIELPEHADWAIKARFNLFRGNSRDRGFVTVPCVASPDPWNGERIDRVYLHYPLIYMILGFDSNVQFISFRFVSRWQWKFRGKFVLVLSFDLYILQRVITDFSRFLLAHLLVPRGVRSKFLWEIVIESPRSYKYAFVSPRETSNKLHNGQTFTRTSKEPREQRWPSTRETFHEIIYWSIKMTHGGIRWHVSVHGWPLILIPVTIRSPDAAFHVGSPLTVERIHRHRLPYD